MGKLRKLFTRHAAGADDNQKMPAVDPDELRQLETAKRRAARVDRIAAAYLGTEVAAITGKDIDPDV